MEFMIEISEETGRDKMKDMVIKIIEKHIKYYNDEIYYDNNMYHSHIDKEIHDNKYERVIDELVDLLDEIKNIE